MQKYNQCIHINPVNSSIFLQYYKHIVSTCPKIKDVDKLLVTVTLHPATSNKKHIIPQTNVSAVPAITSPDPDFDAPFPSCDVDGGDRYSKFFACFKFLDNIHNVTMKALMKAKKPQPLLTYTT